MGRGDREESTPERPQISSLKSTCLLRLESKKMKRRFIKYSSYRHWQIRWMIFWNTGFVRPISTTSTSLSWGLRLAYWTYSSSNASRETTCNVIGKSTKGQKRRGGGAYTSRSELCPSNPGCPPSSSCRAGPSLFVPHVTRQSFCGQCY